MHIRKSVPSIDSKNLSTIIRAEREKNGRRKKMAEGKKLQKEKNCRRKKCEILFSNYLPGRTQSSIMIYMVCNRKLCIITVCMLCTLKICVKLYS